MLIENIDYFVNVVQFPNKGVRFAAVENDDGTFDVYINSFYPELITDYAQEVQELLQTAKTDNYKAKCIRKENGYE